MKKIISKILLFILLTTVAALFAASDVIAFCDNCGPEAPLPISVTAGPYRITLNSINQIGMTSYYRWNYTIENISSPGDLTGLNFFAMLIPDCCNGSININFTESTPDNIQYFPVAEGETTLNFGRYNQQAFVIKGTPDSSAVWELVTTSNTMTTTTALFKFGKGKGDSVSVEVPGPGCAKVCERPAVRVEPRRQCYQFIAETQPASCPEPAQSSTFLAEWDGGEPCAAEVWAAYGDGWTCDNVKIEANILTGEDLFDTVTDESGHKLSEYRTNNSQCDEGWLRFVDENGCNTRCYVSGGKKYCY